VGLEGRDILPLIDVNRVSVHDDKQPRRAPRLHEDCLWKIQLAVVAAAPSTDDPGHRAVRGVEGHDTVVPGVWHDQ
jgi:hypothetical protein